MKYKEWLREWLELYEKPSVKPRTYAQYCDVIERRLIPALGDYDMDELETRVLQRYIVDLSQNGNTRTGKGLAPNSVNAVVLVLHASLTMAYALGLTKAVHVDKIKRPTVREKPVESFTTEEQKLIEQAVLADRRPKMFGIVLCLYTGLRIGELLALEWSDVNLSDAELYVTKSCYDGKDENGQFCRITGTPKTESSRRVIPIPKQLIPHLRELKKKSNSKHVVFDGAKVITVRSYQPDRLICHRDRFIVDSGSNDQNSTILHLIDSILYGSEIAGAILSDIIYFIFLCIHPHAADTADHKKHCTYVSHFSLSHIYLYPMLL